MTKGTSIIIAVLLGLCIASVTAVVLVGQDPGVLLQFFGTIIVPTVAALFAANKADKAANNSAQAVENTNGRMKELVSIVHSLTGTVPEKYTDLASPTPPIRVMPDGADDITASSPGNVAVWDSPPGVK